MNRILIGFACVCVSLSFYSTAVAQVSSSTPERTSGANKTQISTKGPANTITGEGRRTVQGPLDSPNAFSEGFVFYIQDFKFQHQSELNNLNITVKYKYVFGIQESQYPEFRLIVNDIKNFLENYPDEEAYWEILNKEVTAMVMQRYPVLASITSEMQVSPSPMIGYLRASVVTRERPGGR